MILSSVVLMTLLSVTALANELATNDPTLPTNKWPASVEGHLEPSIVVQHSNAGDEQVAAVPTVVEHNHGVEGKEPAQATKYYYLPQYEEQVTVYPQQHDDLEEEDVSPVLYYPPFYPTTTRRPTTRPTTPTRTPRPRPPQWPTTTTTPRSGSGADVQVLENYQIISENGIVEYKLRLSNGLIDHKKITKKRIGNKIIYVQTGYYSTPVDPTKNLFNLIFYIADELGFRVTGVQACSTEQPCRPRHE